jgi:hypothetical protein
LVLGCAIACAFPNFEAKATIPVSKSKPISSLALLLFPLLALTFGAATTAVRLNRVAYVAAQQSGGQGWQARLVVPGHHNESYEWLNLTRQMLARGEWRVRHIDYEDPPSGHEVYSASPYRWWLGLVAVLRHEFSGEHLGPSLEWAALYSDPVLLLLFWTTTVVFVARRFGAAAAALASVALVALFPLGAAFLPGVPDDLGLAQACSIWTILPLLAGVSARVGTGSAGIRRWFTGGGVAAGVGLWVSVAREVPILVGIGLGALAVAWIGRRAAAASPSSTRVVLPWRIWGLSGAATCFAAYILEFFPAHMDAWELRAIHPLFGLALLGGAELLERAAALIGGKRDLGFRAIACWVLAAAAVLALPAAMWREHSLGFLSMDLPTMRLSLLPATPSAPNLWSWLLQNGFTWPVLATLLPLLFVLPASIVLIPRFASPALRIPVALALGPVIAAFCFAIRQISWWNGVDSALVPLLVALGAAVSVHPRRRLVGSLVAAFSAALMLPGLVQLVPSADARIKEGLSEAEVTGLVERDMAYWLMEHAGPSGAVILAPPNLAAPFHYYSGIRGLATFGWEDHDGFQAAVRIMSASTPEEAQELIGAHGITHIIIPSWDPFMDAYAQIGMGQVAGTFTERLHQWRLPPWLKPVSYLVPASPGFEGQSAVVLEVVDEQDDATALSRIAVSLADTGQLDMASRAATGLLRFPANVSALLARAQVENATADNDGFAATADQLVRRISGGGDSDLEWDQRVGLAVVLAQAHHIDLARTRLKACIDDVDEKKLRSMSTILLYRFQVLRRALKLDIANPDLRKLSYELLPTDLRSRAQ